MTGQEHEPTIGDDIIDFARVVIGDVTEAWEQTKQEQPIQPIIQEQIVEAFANVALIHYMYGLRRKTHEGETNKPGVISDLVVIALVNQGYALTNNIRDRRIRFGVFADRLSMHARSRVADSVSEIRNALDN